jgi:glycosyltransferase involved in cell wall biosynthesis
MACKKPVIATCFGGSKEVVLDGQTGYILNPYNTKLMAEKIIDLIKNPAKARTFGQAGYERVKNEFSLEKQAKRTMEWYQRMPSDKRPS